MKLPCCTYWPQREGWHGGCSSLSALLLLAARPGWSSLASLSHSWHSGEKHMSNAAAAPCVQGQNLTTSPCLSHTSKKGPFSCLDPTQGWAWSLQPPLSLLGNFGKGLSLPGLLGWGWPRIPLITSNAWFGLGRGEERHLQTLSCLCAWEWAHGLACGLSHNLSHLAHQRAACLTPAPTDSMAPTTCDSQGWLTACCAQGMPHLGKRNNHLPSPGGSSPHLGIPCQALFWVFRYIYSLILIAALGGRYHLKSPFYRYENRGPEHLLRDLPKLHSLSEWWVGSLVPESSSELQLDPEWTTKLLGWKEK